jgi:hypothetical protein
MMPRRPGMHHGGHPRPEPGAPTGRPNPAPQPAPDPAGADTRVRGFSGESRLWQLIIFAILIDISRHRDAISISEILLVWREVRGWQRGD